MLGFESSSNRRHQQLDEYMELGPLRVSQIDFAKHQSQHSRIRTFKGLPSGHSRITSDSKKASNLRRKTEPFSKQLSPNRNKLQNIKVQLSPQYPSTSKNKSLETFAFERSLEERAKQFIHVINEQKKKVKGKLFHFKQQEQERRYLQQQIEEYERNLVKKQYQLERKRNASENIQKMIQKLKKRAKHSKSRMKQKPLLFLHSQNRKNSKQKQIQSVNRTSRITQNTESKYRDEIEESEELKSAWKKLNILKELMVRQQYLLSRDNMKEW